MESIVFDAKVLEMLGVVDAALAMLGEPRAICNPLFDPGDLTSAFFGDFEIRKAGSIPFRLRVSGETLEIDLADTSELFVWARQDVEKNRVNIATFIRRLLTSRIIVDRWGDAYKRFYQYDNSGNIIEKTSTVRLFNSILPHRRDQYLPIIQRDG